MSQVTDPPAELPQGDSEILVADLLASAATGDHVAWNTIVERYAGLVWSITRGFRLGPADASDISQTVWLRLVENLGAVRDPARLAGWLATTARRECLLALRRSNREAPDDIPDASTRPELSPEWLVLTSDRQRHVWLAVATLSPRCQLLLRALAHDPDQSYADISAALGMPVGSIGPTRSRCLRHLRLALAADDVL